MRRSVAILLAMLFSWLLVLPVFASSSDSNLPACCRKTGKHHCAMRMQQSHEANIAAVSEKCPCLAHMMASTDTERFAPPKKVFVFAGLITQSEALAQVNAGYRISTIRSRQKRGPPSLSIA